MEYYIPKKTGRYFTAGKLYPVLDYMPDGGIVTADDTNTDHYLSGVYLLENFKKASETEIRIALKK